MKGPTPAYVLHGRNGSFLKSRGDIQEDALKSGKQPKNEDWGIEPVSEQGLLYVGNNKTHIPTEQGNYMEFYDSVYRAITEDTDMPVSTEHAIQTMKIIAAAQQSETRSEVVIL